MFRSRSFIGWACVVVTACLVWYLMTLQNRVSDDEPKPSKAPYKNLKTDVRPTAPPVTQSGRTPVTPEHGENILERVQKIVENYSGGRLTGEMSFVLLNATEAELEPLLKFLQTLEASSEIDAMYQMTGGRAWQLLGDKAITLLAAIEGDERKAGFENGMKLRQAQTNSLEIQQKLLEEGKGRKLSSEESNLLALSFGKSLEQSPGGVASIAAKVEKGLAVMVPNSGGKTLAALAGYDADAALAILGKAGQLFPKSADRWNLAFIFGNQLSGNRKTLTSVANWLENSTASPALRSAVLRGALPVFQEWNPSVAERLKALQPNWQAATRQPPVK